MVIGSKGYICLRKGAKIPEIFKDDNKIPDGIMVQRGQLVKFGSNPNKKGLTERIDVDGAVGCFLNASDYIRMVFPIKIPEINLK